MYDNYLVHYGILGMRWGQSRLSKRITRAEKLGKSEKASRLKNRLEEEKMIEKLDFSDKVLLSREGTLANLRLINKGQSKARRLIELHGLALATDLTSKYVANRVKPERSLDINLSEAGHLSIKETGLITSMGIELVRSVVSRKAKDHMYRKIGQN